MVFTVPAALNGANLTHNSILLGHLKPGYKMQIFTPVAAPNVRIAKRRDDIFPLGSGAAPVYQGIPVQPNVPVEITWEGDVFAVAEGAVATQADINIARA